MDKARGIKMTKAWLRCVVLFMPLLLSMPVNGRMSAMSDEETRTLSVSSWLVNGPFKEHLPVFHSTKNIKGKEFTLAELLEFQHVDVKDWWPSAGEILAWDGSVQSAWREMVADSNCVTFQVAAVDSLPEVNYLAAYVEAKRFTKAKIELSSFHLFRAFLDGEMLVEKKEANKPKDDTTTVEPGTSSKEVTLETGKHLLLVKLLRDPKSEKPWNLHAKIQVPSEWDTGDVVVNTSPTEKMTIRRLLDGPKVGGVSISPDGEVAAITLRQSLPPSDESESWIELRNVSDGGLRQTFRGGMKISGITWSPIGKRFSYTTSDKEGQTLWIVDLVRGTTTPLLKDIKDLGGHTWSPDGTFIIYSVTEKPDEDKTGLKKLEGMPDRWPEWRNRSFLYRVSVPSGICSRLTAGEFSTSLSSISPDGRKLIFTRSYPDFTERPYSKTECFVLDLATLKVDTLWTSNWVGGADWSPDGKKLLVRAGPSAFGGIGKAVPEGTIPNEYDTQAFIYDLETKHVDPITREFDPSIGRAIWSKTEDCIYFTATDRTYRNLYRYDLKRKSYELIDTGVEVIGGLDIAENKPIAVYTGSGVSLPPKAYVIDLKKRRFRLLADPGSQDYRHVHFGQVERWTFTNASGSEIEGRIYYPPDFDPNSMYPCIVYYYGGTSPVSRDFGGRYPKELYTANGYVVYVLQPSGATGFGQAFSALHVNNWGITVADEIIDGTEKFLDAHPFVDKNRVGCIGASYGGFMTMLLTTRTDMFAAAVAHAGISSISSYWGEGYWGYLYSSSATANSFPWNRRDIYIDQSPLFHADQVTTPLLLLHGADDTNVPPGESRQFYTALKLLGKEVELIEVAGQNHHIMQYNKRIRWTKTILAWFDRWLKDQPEWWEDMYSQK